MKLISTVALILLPLVYPSSTEAQQSSVTDAPSSKKEDQPPGTLGTCIIAVTPDGYGIKYVIPFRGNFKSGGLRMWEVLSEPYFAKGEDPNILIDVNLISLCNIKIIAARPESDPANLSVDMSSFSIPAWIQIPEDEIIGSLLYCIIEGTRWSPRNKPKLTFIGKDEAKKKYEQANAAYEKATLGQKIDFPTKNK